MNEPESLSPDSLECEADEPCSDLVSDPLSVSRDQLERRLLVLTPTGRDAALARGVLDRNSVPCTVCEDWPCLIRELDAGAGAVLLTEEVLLDAAADAFTRTLVEQPAWSDIPVLVLTTHGADSLVVERIVRTIANVTLLERPTRVAALLSAALSALRARERQYQIRAHLAALERSAQALRASEKQLREADARKDEFLATLAHELRNPLAPIRHSLQILRLTGEGDPALVRIREMMDRQLSMMVRLVDDLLEVSRITRGKIEMQLSRVDIGAVVRSAVETSRPVIDAGGHTLSVDVQPDLPVTSGDPMRLAQVFSNLLNNAAKYTDDNGRIEVSARAVGGEIRVAVRDSGIGIAPEMLPRVFEMFTQVRRSTSRAQGGLGVGLTLVKSLVDLHQGRVAAHSEGLGKGSEFVVMLPVTLPQSDEAAPPEHVLEVGVLQARRAVVVDDNRDSADSLAMLLELMGAEVRVGYSGPDGLEGLASRAPDIMFVDIGMPEMDGYEVARRVRGEPACANVLLIALTGWGQAEDRLRSQEAGFDHHLVKPVDVDRLETLLRGWTSALPTPSKVTATAPGEVAHAEK